MISHLWLCNQGTNALASVHHSFNGTALEPIVIRDGCSKPIQKPIGLRETLLMKCQLMSDEHQMDRVSNRWVSLHEILVSYTCMYFEGKRQRTTSKRIIL